VNLVPGQGPGERSHGSRRPEVPWTRGGDPEGRGRGPAREGGNTGETEECTNRHQPDARMEGGGEALPLEGTRVMRSKYGFRPGQMPRQDGSRQAGGARQDDATGKPDES